MVPHPGGPYDPEPGLHSNASGFHIPEAGAAMQNEANWGRVLSFKFEVPSGWAGANVQNEAGFLDGWNDAKRQPKNELW